jgi:rubredoxin
VLHESTETIFVDKYGLNITVIRNENDSQKHPGNFTIQMEEIMAKYECPCGYVYDPAEGDYENGVEPDTPFEDLPDDWVCPKCGAEKEYFEKID